MQLSPIAANHIRQIPVELHRDFPRHSVPELEIRARSIAERLVAGAHFDDYIPLLVRRALRDRLRDGSSDLSRL